MIIKSIRDQIELKLSFLFGVAGLFDRVITRLRMITASDERKNQIINAFHLRWETQVLKEIADENAEIAKRKIGEQFIDKRNESFRPRLDYIRNHKEILLHIKH